MPPQDMLLWNVDYFRLVNFEKLQTWFSRSCGNQVEVSLCKRIFTFVREITIRKGVFLTVPGLPSLSVEKAWA